MKVIGTVLLIICSMAFGATDRYEFSNQQHYQDFTALTHELRCLVCQNQTIADSNAPLAEDLRQQIYDQLESGQDRDHIRAFMVSRYGDFILYKPALTQQTFLLWVGPFILLFICALMVFLFIKRQRQC